MKKATLENIKQVFIEIIDQALINDKQLRIALDKRNHQLKNYRDTCRYLFDKYWFLITLFFKDNHIKILGIDDSESFLTSYDSLQPFSSKDYIMIKIFFTDQLSNSSKFCHDLNTFLNNKIDHIKIGKIEKNYFTLFIPTEKEKENG